MFFRLWGIWLYFRELQLQLSHFNSQKREDLNPHVWVHNVLFISTSNSHQRGDLKGFLLLKIHCFRGLWILSSLWIWISSSLNGGASPLTWSSRTHEAPAWSWYQSSGCGLKVLYVGNQLVLITLLIILDYQWKPQANKTTLSLTGI